MNKARDLETSAVFAATEDERTQLLKAAGEALGEWSKVGFMVGETIVPHATAVTVGELLPGMIVELYGKIMRVLEDGKLQDITREFWAELTLVTSACAADANGLSHDYHARRRAGLLPV